MKIGIDIVAGVLTLLGVYMVGNKNKFGFLIALASNIAWITYVIVTGHTFGVALECLPLTVINLRNFIKWRKEEKKNEK